MSGVRFSDHRASGREGGCGVRPGTSSTPVPPPGTTTEEAVARFEAELAALGVDPARADRYIVDDSQLTITPRAATGSHVRHLGSQR
jgi:hypothetical protein